MTRRGRPPGRTQRGEETRRRVFDAAVQMFAERGYDRTTLRAIATSAGVSPALVYRHFDGKAAIVMALYDELSAGFADTPLHDGTMAERLVGALRGSLETLSEHRRVLVGVLPALLADAEAGLLSARARSSREQVEAVFVRAVSEASDAPRAAPELGQLAYLAHLMVLLFWTLDRSEDQAASRELLAWITDLAPRLSLVLWVPGSVAVLTTLNRIVRSGLLTDRE